MVALSLAGDTPFFLADSSEKVKLWTTGDVVATYDPTAGGMRLVFGTSEWPSLHLKPKLVYDFSKFGALALKITNPNPFSVEIGVRCDDDPTANGYLHSKQGQIVIPAHQTYIAALPVGQDPKSFGMNGIPRRKGLNSMSSSGGPGWNPRNVVDLQMFMHQPEKATTVILKEISLTPPVSMVGIVDQYGQYAQESWPGKLGSDSEFRKRLAAERGLLRNSKLAGRDQYGGWLGGPKQQATGFFRTAKVDGKWWFVDPAGNLFFSNGCDCLSLSGATFTSGREEMFSWLPKTGDPLSEFAGFDTTNHGGVRREGKSFRFYQANLLRKYGANWREEWRSISLDRMNSWGFNTIGNWSDTMFHGNGKVPYVYTTSVGGKHKHVASGSDYWGQMHDPFDPEFRASVQQAVAGTAKIRNDPYCLGTFIDNELSWSGQGPENGRYGLGIGALSYEAKDSPAKQAFVQLLKSRYSSIIELNKAWKTNFVSWADLELPYKTALSFSAKQKEDLSSFVTLLSETYHRIVREELKKVDPNHLYLGCRFAWYGQDAVEAASKYTDVISFNIYKPALNQKEWGWVKALNKPIIIGEFHFGATDRGMFHPGLVDAGTQAGRAKMYHEYVQSVASNPAFVGCHWFQYVDEPLTGRTLDGENYQIGMVDVTDTPYPEAIKAAKEIHSKVYEIHSRAK